MIIDIFKIFNVEIARNQKKKTAKVNDKLLTFTYVYRITFEHHSRLETRAIKYKRLHEIVLRLRAKI